MSVEPEYTAFEEYVDHLQKAANELEKALDCLYKTGGIKRGVGYRLRLAKAQTIAMTLLVREINRKAGHNTGGACEWELVDTHYECIYCERRTKIIRVNDKPVFIPDALRHIPVLGRKWRCYG